MRKDHGRRFAGVRKRTLIATLALMVPLAALGVAPPAMATPKGIFSVFSDCPLADPGLALCTISETTSGEFVLGTAKVPINQTITLQGGAIKTGNPENEREFFLVPAKDGNSLSKTELNVPGGLLGLINCEEIKGEGFFEKSVRAACKAVFESGATQVTATTELVANAKNPALLDEVAFNEETGTALTLPVRIHLKNTFLGKSCYVGSESHPLQLHLTTGATHPPEGFKSIHGSAGIPETLEEHELPLLRDFELSLVDNTFAAPGAEGCGEFLFIKGFLNSIIDGKLKIPNTAGNNTAVLKGELKVATPERVIESEKF
jgi:hypothetical protein